MALLLWLLVTAAVANPFTVSVDRIKSTAQGITLTLSYVNNLPYAMNITLEWPPAEHAVVTDNHGQEYTLSKSTGMLRRDIEANYDLMYPVYHAKYNPQKHSIFLHAPPKQPVKATFLFTRTGKEPPQTVDVTIGHYARPADTTVGMAPVPSRTVTFTATFTDVPLAR
jgi:hypothetical protein